MDLRRLAALMSDEDRDARRARLRAQAMALVTSESLIEASYCYAIVQLDAPADVVLQADGAFFHASRLLPESGKLTALACAVCTLGPRLEQRVGELFHARRASLALALDRLGNEFLLALARLTQDRMLADAARQNLTMAGELRAGDPGLALDAQGEVLRLAGASAIGVSLTEGQVMRPVKSVSMVLGVGIDLPPATWSRCDECPSRAQCRVAQGARAPALASAP